MIYCLNCGKGIPDESKFCTFCGTPTPHVDPQTHNISSETTEHRQSVPPPVQPVTQQYVTPAPQVTITNTITQSKTTKNEFYKNIGFWGAVLTFIGFFLPYVNGNDASFYYLVSDLAQDSKELYLYLIFPVSAAIIILQGLTGFIPRFIISIFKVLPFLMLILFAIGISKNSSSFGFMGSDLQSILGSIGIGLYMTVIGSFLMLFFRTTKTEV